MNSLLVLLAFQTLLVVSFIPFIFRYSILACSCVLTLVLTVDYTDELVSQDLHLDSSALDLDFDSSSDESSEFEEFAAESPELQGSISLVKYVFTPILYVNNL